ncbi:hypothetical protein ABZ442_01410 [Streptomyces triculaminicus]|uniref:hypothetical protein n=1 Tax=Streptomyces triculaminicus TaxID=2816232 RepID=UPI0033EFC87E
MRPPRPVLVTVLVAPVVAGAAALAAYTAPEESAEPPPTPPLRTAQEPRELTSTEKDTLHSAEQILLRDCMREKGFEYRPVPREPVPDAREFLYVIEDTDWARRHGYGTDIERRMSELRTSDPNQRYFRSLPAEQRAKALAAANGRQPQGLTATGPDGVKLTRSPQGCRSEAERTLYRDLGAWFQARATRDALRQMRIRDVTSDAEYAPATRAWARCMRQAGHDYADPAALRRSLPPPERPLPRNQEIALATAEANCAHTSGLAETAKRLDRKHDAQLRGRYASDVNTASRLQLEALPRAREIVRAG